MDQRLDGCTGQSHIIQAERERPSVEPQVEVVLQAVAAHGTRASRRGIDGFYARDQRGNLGRIASRRASRHLDSTPSIDRLQIAGAGKLELLVQAGKPTRDAQFQLPRGRCRARG
jgi:hypothetical protein